MGCWSDENKMGKLVTKIEKWLEDNPEGGDNSFLREKVHEHHSEVVEFRRNMDLLLAKKEKVIDTVELFG